MTNSARLLLLLNIFIGPNITKNEEKTPKQLTMIFLHRELYSSPRNNNILTDFSNNGNTHTHTHTHIYIHIHIQIYEDILTPKFLTPKL